MGARAAAPTHSSARRPPPPGCLRSEWGRRKAGRGWGKAGPGRARRSALPARSQRGTGTARPRSGDGAGRGGGGGDCSPRAAGPAPCRQPRPPRGAPSARGGALAPQPSGFAFGRAGLGRSGAWLLQRKKKT